MKKLLTLVMILTSILYVSCAKSEESDEDKLGSIYGIVTAEGTSEPVKGITISLYQDDKDYSEYYDKFSDSKETLLLKTTTFDDGHFEFSDLKPHVYRISANTDMDYHSELVTVEAGRQARVDLRIEITGTIYGVITDSWTSYPLSDVLVELQSVDHYFDKYQQTTGRNGQYEFTNLKPQKYVLSISKYGYYANPTTVSLRSGEKMEVNINTTPQQ